MKKNYIYLIIMMLATVVVTLLLASIYNKEVVHNCYAYENMNKIIPDEFEAYMQENPDTIIYIGDKYDLTLEKVEKKLSQKIDELNLKHSLIYIDKEYVDKKFIKKLKGYDINIDLNKLPVVVVVVEEEVIKNIILNSKTNIDELIISEAFE